MKQLPTRPSSSAFSSAAARAATAFRTLGIAALAVACGCSDDDDDEGASPATLNSASTTLSNAGFDSLVVALENAGLTATIESATAATVLAPTDAAMAAPLANGADFDALDDATSADVLAYHLLDGAFDGADLNGPSGTGIGQVATLDGRTVRVERVGNGLWANDVPLTTLDLATTNGFVQRLDGVLLPPQLDVLATLHERGYSIFATALENEGFAGVLADPGSDLTLFAPSDDAILAQLGSPALNDLLKPENADDFFDVLLYHAALGSVSAAEGTAVGEVATAIDKPAFFLVEGDSLRISGATVEAINVPSGNGIVHGIDRLLGTDTVADALAGYNLGTLDTAVGAGDVTATLADFAAPATLFAPTDEAFAALPAGELDGLLADGPGGELPGLLNYHTVLGKLRAAEIDALDEPLGLDGGALIVEELGGELRVNDARVVHRDLPASTGFVQRIDRVLRPPTDIYATLQARGLDTLVAAIDAADASGLFDGSQANERTLLAPTEAAFEALAPGLLECLLDPQQGPALQALLLGHVVPGRHTAGEALDQGTLAPLAGAPLDVAIGVDGLPTVDGVQLSVVNIPCTNGVVHLLDAVLTDGFDASVPNLSAMILGQTELGAFYAALDVVDLTDVLEGDGPFTVLAPGFTAFQQVPGQVGLGSFAELLLPENEELLTAILEHHIISGQVLCGDDLVEASPLTTLGGEQITVTDIGGLQFDGQAGVTVGDLLASNGVLHIVDAVILPPSVLIGQSGATADESVEPVAAAAGHVAALSAPIADERSTPVAIQGSTPVAAGVDTGGALRTTIRLDRTRGAGSAAPAGIAAARRASVADGGAPPELALVLLVGAAAEVDGAVARFGFASTGEPADAIEPAAPAMVFDGPLDGRIAIWVWPLGAESCVLERPALEAGPELGAEADAGARVLLWLP